MDAADVLHTTPSAWLQGEQAAPWEVSGVQSGHEACLVNLNFLTGTEQDTSDPFRQKGKVLVLQESHDPGSQGYGMSAQCHC